jgi:hypothetical protein
MTTEQTTTEQGAPFAPCSPFALLALCGEQGNAFALLGDIEQGKGVALCGAPFALCGEQTTTEQTTEQGAPFVLSQIFISFIFQYVSRKSAPGCTIF